VVAQLDRSPGRADAGGGDGVLDRHRYTGERPDGSASRAGVVDCAGLGPGAVVFDRDHRVDRAIESLDAFEVVIEEFSGGHITRDERSDDFDQR